DGAPKVQIHAEADHTVVEIAHLRLMMPDAIQPVVRECKPVRERNRGAGGESKKRAAVHTDSNARRVRVFRMAALEYAPSPALPRRTGGGRRWEDRSMINAPPPVRARP